MTIKILADLLRTLVPCSSLLIERISGVIVGIKMVSCLQNQLTLRR